MNQESDLIIVLDNASIHHSSIAFKNTLDIIFMMMFMPAYSPSLAPFELFYRIIKNEIRKSIYIKEICFNWQEDRVMIYCADQIWKNLK